MLVRGGGKLLTILISVLAQQGDGDLRGDVRHPDRHPGAGHLRDQDLPAAACE